MEFSDWLILFLQFNPGLVLVSAGFDAARGDPLGGYHVTPEGYAHLTHLLMSLAGGRVLLILEVHTHTHTHIQGWVFPLFHFLRYIDMNEI